MRYYHYLSSNKIEMLYQQMAEYKPKVTTDIGLDLKVFKGGRKSERSETEPNVYGKLSVVESWIYEHEPVGSVDEPGVWIYGRELLGFSPYPRRIEVEAVDATGGSPVFFAGKTHGNSTIIMCGSSGNLIQNSNKKLQFSAYSEIHYLSALFAAIVDSSNEFPFLLSIEQANAISVTSPSQPNFFRSLGTTPEAAIRASQQVVDDLRFVYAHGRPSHYEFLAKRIKSVSHKDVHFSVATPLFVALLD